MEITNEFKAFLAVAETESFTRAAEQLNLSQPAISKRVANLEDVLKTRLFDRIGNRIILTSAGETLLPRATKILQDVEDCRRAIINLSGETRGELKVAISHHIALHRLPNPLKRYTETYPLVDMGIKFTDSEAAISRVLHGEAELSLTTLPKALDDHLYSETLWIDPLAVTVAKHHPVLKQKDFSIKQLSKIPAILPQKYTYTRQLIEPYLKTTGLEVHLIQEINYLETIKTMVRAGLGWSVLPVTLVDECDSLVLLDEVPAVRHLGFVIHKNRTLSNAAKALMELMREDAQSDPHYEQVAAINKA